MTTARHLVLHNSGRPRSPRVSIVVPAKNEARNLELILPRLPDVHEVILVDGHSVDGTVEVARRVRPEIRVVAQTRKGKATRFRFKEGKQANWKKAVVTLHEEDKIEFF